MVCRIREHKKGNIHVDNDKMTKESLFDKRKDTDLSLTLASD